MSFLSSDYSGFVRTVLNLLPCSFHRNENVNPLSFFVQKTNKESFVVSTERGDDVSWWKSLLKVFEAVVVFWFDFDLFPRGRWSCPKRSRSSTRKCRYRINTVTPFSLTVGGLVWPETEVEECLFFFFSG